MEYKYFYSTTQDGTRNEITHIEYIKMMFKYANIKRVKHSESETINKCFSRKEETPVFLIWTKTA